MKDMKILFVSPEISPFAKTGGLADVAQALPKALKAAGHDVISVMPKYSGVSHLGIPMAHVGTMTVETRNGLHGAGICRSENGGVPTLFIENEGYFHRDGMYGRGEWNYPDNLDRFVFFCKAAVEACRCVDFAPDIIHCNDWQTAALPVLFKLVYLDYRQDPFFAHRPKVVFSIHNIAYQGLFPEDQWPTLSIPRNYFSNDFEFYGQINLMKSAIIHADAVHTVSETYAWEIQHTEFGFGLQGVLQQRKGSLQGILNGADYSEWSPEKDPYTEGIHYSAEDISGKRAIKARLRSQYHLPDNDATPLIGLTSRLVPQKGLDLVVQSAQRILQLDAQLIVLGDGEQRYHDFFEWLRSTYPDKVAVYHGFNNELAHKIIAAADIFLMPSHFEPCGLSQIYSLRYGTLPVVRLTGGLADTIQEGTNGFTFFDYNAFTFFDAVARAVDVYHTQPDRWRDMIATAMRQDFSWQRSAEKMVALYESLL